MGSFWCGKTEIARNNWIKNMQLQSQSNYKSTSKNMCTYYTYNHPLAKIIIQWHVFVAWTGVEDRTVNVYLDAKGYALITTRKKLYQSTLQKTVETVHSSGYKKE